MDTKLKLHLILKRDYNVNTGHGDEANRQRTIRVLQKKKRH